MLCSGLADSKAVTDIHLRKNGIEDTTEQRNGDICRLADGI